MSVDLRAWLLLAEPDATAPLDVGRVSPPRAGRRAGDNDVACARERDDDRATPRKRAMTQTPMTANGGPNDRVDADSMTIISVLITEVNITDARTQANNYHCNGLRSDPTCPCRLRMIRRVGLDRTCR